MKLLDLFCGAGGAAMGYSRAGFEVVGVDIELYHNFPFEFIQDDALSYVLNHAHEFDVIHASPPCQVYSVTAGLSNGKHPDLIAETRAVLQAIGKPYIIENVPGAPLINPLKLCGTMFGLPLIRHRLFESDPVLWWPPMACSCHGVFTSSHRGWSAFENGAQAITVVGNNYAAADGRKAMGIDWMVKRELSQAIPPAYTEWIGRRMMALLYAQREGADAGAEAPGGAESQLVPMEE